MANTSIIPQDLAQRRFCDSMQLVVGRGRRWSCPAVAEATGIPLRTIESYRSGQAAPSLGNYQSLCAVLGQAFFGATIEHLPFAVRSTEPGDRTPQQLLTNACGFATQLAEMLEDGRIDHTEEPEFKAALAKIREQVAALEASLEHSS